LGPARGRWRRWQLAILEGPGLSLEADEVNQALTGVSVRRPWADVDLWELFLSLPAEAKFPDLRRKGLVRDLLRGSVPDEILDRRSKTFFNDAVLARIDYAALRRWVSAPAHRIPGVDYERLGQRLEQEDLDAAGFIWARDLAAVHAFLALW
ncbi:MAG: asparagine synthase-related protein, partial [Thermoleophilaceae bacterium]